MDKIIIYTIIHLFGNFMVILSLGGNLVWAINKGERNHVWRKQTGLLHGVGLLVSLIGGFGLLAVLKVPFPFPIWVWGKLAVWVCFAGLLPLILRKREHAKAYWYAVLILILVALILVEFKF